MKLQPNIFNSTLNITIKILNLLNKEALSSSIELEFFGRIQKSSIDLSLGFSDLIISYVPFKTISDHFLEFIPLN